jgi:hypothetical protein
LEKMFSFLVSLTYYVLKSTDILEKMFSFLFPLTYYVLKSTDILEKMFSFLNIVGTVNFIIWIVAVASPSIEM